MYITIERVTNHGLDRKAYSFDVYVPAGNQDLRVRYNGYREESRPSRRHRNWSLEKRWDRLGRMSYLSTKDTPKPDLPDDVREELVERLRSAFVFEL